jgi:PAS domain S-box-containing protein
VSSRDISQREGYTKSVFDLREEKHKRFSSRESLPGELTASGLWASGQSAAPEQVNSALHTEFVRRWRKAENGPASEEHYRTIFENANDAIVFIALDGTITNVNRSAERLAGLSRGQIMGRPFTQFLTPASVALAEERVRRALAGEPLPSTFEIELLRSNGRTVAVEARARFLRDQKGTVVGILGIYRDITERKQIEEALRQAHAELEQRVQQRTADLARTNEALRAEVAERKRAEDAARAAEREYRALFENAVEGIYRSSLDGHQLRANPALVKLNGYESEAEMLPAVNNIATEWYVDPHRREEFQRILAEQESVMAFESEVYRHKTRERIWISESARLVRDQHGTPLYYEGTVQDITTRKRAEEALQNAHIELEKRVLERTTALLHINTALQAEIEERKRVETALRQSEEQYRDLFENANDVIGIGTLEHIITSINRRIEQMLGYPREEFVGKYFHDFATPKSRALLEDRTRRRLAGDQVSPIVELELVHRDNSIVIVEGTAHIRRDPDGKPIGIHAIYRDVTARKRAEAALEQLRQQHELILTSAGEGILGSDAQGRATFVNPAGARMLGYEVHELLGQPLHDRIHHHKADGTPYPFAECPSFQVVRNGHTTRVTNEVYWRKDGTSFPVEYLTAPIRNNANEVIGFVSTFRDITERKEVERIKDELISTVSHELRTPLASLRGFAELMLKRNFTPEKQHELLSVIHNEAIRLTHLIDDFLDLQRIEGGHQPYTFVSLALEPLFRNSLELFAKVGGSHLLRLELASALPRVRGDANRLRQVLVNLISNAIKFSPQGGEIEIGARAEAHQVVVWVKDQGVGIPREALPKLFTKFFRVDNSDTHNISGTGLGLALVREIVHAHQGKVWVDSTPKVGSTFFFTLPSHR